MKIIFLILPLAITFPAQAEDICDKAISTQAINKCAQFEYQKSDKKLNSAYQAALKNFESSIDDVQQRKDTKQGLVEAQRLWVQFRDKDCGAIYNLWKDGTIRGAMYWGCMTDRTENRTKELEQFINAEH